MSEFKVDDRVRVKETGEAGVVIRVREVSNRPFVVGFGEEDSWGPYAAHELERAEPPPPVTPSSAELAGAREAYNAARTNFDDWNRDASGEDLPPYCAYELSGAAEVYIATLLTALAHADAQRVRLEGALKPFASAWNSWLMSKRWGITVHATFESHMMERLVSEPGAMGTATAFQAAAAALAASAPAGDGQEGA